MRRFHQPLAIACLLLLLGEVAHAQCTTASCRPQMPPNAAIARVIATIGGSRSLGSGTLVHRDDQRGVVLTCAHLFDDGRESVAVVFPDGVRVEATVLRIDRVWDLAALEIASPDYTPIAIAFDPPSVHDPLRSSGYGADGDYWVNEGRAMGYVTVAGASTHETLQLSGCARDGDSGGPVLNARGELAAVLWGTDGRRVLGTYCGRIRKFLADILGVSRDLPKQLSPMKLDPLPRLPSDDDSVTIQAALGERLKAIESAIASRTDRPSAPASFVETALPPLLAALGWTGPPSLLGMLAIRLAASALRYRANKRDTPVRSEHLNDDYAAQLAQVYELSGRSPMADVTLGREYDQELEQAATGSDVALARWARALRQRVARRLYRIHADRPVASEPTS